MKKSSKKNILLFALLLATPFLIIGLINGWYYVLHISECRASTESQIGCYLERICFKKDISFGDCYGYLKQSVSEITSRALASNDSTICKEAERKLQFICYYEFAKKLEFTLDEVFAHNLKSNGLGLCDSLSGQLQKKCFFNLALETQNPDLCSETEELAKRCTASISLIWNRISPDDIYTITKSKINANNKRPHVKFSFLLDMEEYFTGKHGWLRLYNDDDVELNGEKFYLFKNLRLVDADGCDETLIPPRYGCTLDFSTLVEWEVLEVTYDNETVYVDPGCITDSCREEYEIR